MQKVTATDNQQSMKSDVPLAFMLLSSQHEIGKYMAGKNKHNGYVKPFLRAVSLASLMLFLQGCGTSVLDGSSPAKLQESFKAVKSGLSDQKQQVKFEVAYNILNIYLSERVKKGGNENSLRMELFNGKDARTLVEQARTYEQGKVDSITAELKVLDNCYKSLKSGLKVENATLRSSSVKPEERVELSFDLHNGSQYPVSMIQANVTLQVFGAPGMEKLFAGRDVVNCTAKKIVNPGSIGRMSCSLSYEMGPVRYEGPAQDVQNFVIEIVDNDDTPLNDKDDQNTMAYCKEQSEQLKRNINLYLNDLESLMGF